MNALMFYPRVSVPQFRGWEFHRVLLPMGQQLVCFHRTEYASNATVHDRNHNIFRLDWRGRVAWQVRRADGDEIDWANLARFAQEHGDDNEHLPFKNLIVVDRHGARKLRDGEAVTRDRLERGGKVYSEVCGGYLYEIDIDTGVATVVNKPAVPRWGRMPSAPPGVLRASLRWLQAPIVRPALPA